MSKIGDFYQEADFKKEKHSPVIEGPDSVSAGKAATFTASVGKEIGHPNTTEHHIAWINLFFKPDGDKFIYQLSSSEFRAHGASAKGANEGPTFTEPVAQVTVTLKESGTLIATSNCNIHGLWESQKKVTVS